MKVLINGLQLNKRFSGVQYYLESLLQEFVTTSLSDVGIKVLLPKSNHSKVIATQQLHIKHLPINTNVRLLRVSYENIFLSTFVKRTEIDILHNPAYILPPYGKFKSIITVHDIIALDHPNLCSWPNANYFKYLLPISIKKANKIIAVSNKVKEDILDRFNIPEEKIKVIYHGIPSRYSTVNNSGKLKHVTTKYNLPKQFILFVGNIEPKKNLDVLIKAFTLLIDKKDIPHALVLVGQKAWKSKILYRTIQNHKYKERILLPGYVDENDLPAIYTLAEILVLPSLYEGFGYPVLEAMKCGTPVVCSNKGALPEISGGNCLLTDPESIEHLSDRLYCGINDKVLRQDLIQRGLNWSKTFTLKRMATETLKLYKETG